MAERSYEAIVIGAGPGGYPAGIRLGRLGVRALVVEKEYFGGVCLNWGCIPSKALIHAANTYHALRGYEEMGIHVGESRVDLPAMQRWKDDIVDRLTRNVESLLKANGTETLRGAARLISPDRVRVEKADGRVEHIRAEKGIVLATGARLLSLPGMPIDGEVVLGARDLVSRSEPIGTLVVIGGGVIGMELGMVWQKLGARVIVVELLPQILSGVDADLVRVVRRAFERAGGELHLESKVERIDRRGARAELTIATKSGGTIRVDADAVLMSVGFAPNSGELGLEALGVALDRRGHVIVDEHLRTNVPSLYAVGDVTGAPYLAHRATKQGEIVAEVIAGQRAAADWRAMPSAIFTEPEIATVGLSETQAKERGLHVTIGKYPFSASGRAMAMRATDGFIKTVIDAETGEVLGAGIVGPEASTMISEVALGLEMGAFAEDVRLTVHPHPTLGEALMESFAHALGEAVHILNR